MGLTKMNVEILAIKDKIINAVPIEKLYLFGSYANGTPTENSDYDFYMVIPNNGMRPLDAINKAYLAMRGFKRKPADILAGTADVFSHRAEGITLERKIAREGILLYEREQ
jgi:predicted nucleotidyltransferase